MTTTGLVGLGQMGLPMASRIATRFDVLAFDIDETRRSLAEEEPRVRTTDTLAALADCATIVLSLPTPAVSRDVLQTLLPSLGQETLIVETSTVLPDDVRASGRLITGVGARIVDAAVLSGVGQMRDGAATLLVGGADADVDSVIPLLEVIGAGGVERFGPLGAGMAAKVVNNGVAHAVMVVLVEAFAMAAAEGVAPEGIADMLSRADGGLQRPLAHRIRERVATSDYDGGMPLDAARKDSTLALAMAQRSGIPIFATQAAQTVYDLAVADGLGREDYAAIARLWEGWTGRSLAFPVAAAEVAG